MIFEYEELKECVEDFERFYKMGFNEKQILPAVLNEYEQGADFGLVENICILVFLSLIYPEKNLDCIEISEKISQLMNEEVEKETTKALMLLEEMDSKKALELGKDIIKYNKGDDHLQATVWNILGKNAKAY